MMRRAGLVCFVVGVILFFSDRYLHLLIASFPQDQATAAAFGTYFVLQLGGLALIVAGAVLFIASRRHEKLAANS